MFLQHSTLTTLFPTYLLSSSQIKYKIDNFHGFFCAQTDSLSRRDVIAYITITIKPEKLRILHHDIWGTVSLFIVDLNADIRGGFTNFIADYQKLRQEIGVGI